MDVALANRRRLVLADSIPSGYDLSQWTELIVLIAAWSEADLDPQCEDAVRRLTRMGCSYFVCAGSMAEHLHDTVDAVVELEGPSDHPVPMTTWDVDAAEAVEFFLRIAGARDGAFLLALLRSEEDPLRAVIHSAIQ